MLVNTFVLLYWCSVTSKSNPSVLWQYFIGYAKCDESFADIFDLADKKIVTMDEILSDGVELQDLFHVFEQIWHDWISFIFQFIYNFLFHNVSVIFKPQIKWF